MAHRSDILDFLDELLESQSFPDYGPNGLQVPGATEIKRVASGVSANLELLRRAIDDGAQLVLVHHGLFWKGQPLALTPTMAARLRVLLAADANLAAYHLPLDAHAEVGNNALLADGLGLVERRPFGAWDGRHIGIAGRLPGDGASPEALLERVRELVGREPLAFPAGPDPVRTIGIVSGGGAKLLAEAVDDGLDAFLTGEPSEPAMGEAREAGVHFIAAGHYATETFGIRRLGELVAERFGVEHAFIDVPNPV